MAQKSSIEWTEATWNPIRGCSVVSPGCKNCYAMKQAHRFSGEGQAYEGLTQLTKNGPVWTGKVRFVPDALCDPLRWSKPRRVFVNSMSDLFHEGVSDAMLLNIFTVMGNSHIATGNDGATHTFQILTKRPQRMKEFMSRLRWQCGLAIVDWFGWKGMLNYMPYLEGRADETWVSLGGGGEKPFSKPVGWQPSNVWLGVSCENQKAADERIPLLLQTPAAVRWVSAEPLLGPIDFEHWFAMTCRRYETTPPHPSACDGENCKGRRVDWVVVGGESGPGARPMNEDWMRSIVNQCKAAKVPVFVKQMGAKPYCVDGPQGPTQFLGLMDKKGGDIREFPADLQIREYPA